MRRLWREYIYTERMARRYKIIQRLPKIQSDPLAAFLTSLPAVLCYHLHHSCLLTHSNSHLSTYLFWTHTHIYTRTHNTRAHTRNSRTHRKYPDRRTDEYSTYAYKHTRNTHELYTYASTTTTTTKTDIHAQPSLTVTIHASPHLPYPNARLRDCGPDRCVSTYLPR